MKQVYLKYIVGLFLLNSFFLYCQQTLEEQYQYSFKLFNEGKYFDAITELKRLNFFDAKKIYSYKSNLLIGEAYEEGAKYSDALKYFTLAEINAANDSDLFTAKTFEVRINILRRTTNRALQLLNELQLNDKFKNREKKFIIGKAGHIFLQMIGNRLRINLEKFLHPIP